MCSSSDAPDPPPPPPPPAPPPVAPPELSIKAVKKRSSNARNKKRTGKASMRRDLASLNTSGGGTSGLNINKS